MIYISINVEKAFGKIYHHFMVSPRACRTVENLCQHNKISTQETHILHGQVLKHFHWSKRLVNNAPECRFCNLDLEWGKLKSFFVTMLMFFSGKLILNTYSGPIPQSSIVIRQLFILGRCVQCNSSMKKR